MRRGLFRLRRPDFKPPPSGAHLEPRCSLNGNKLAWDLDGPRFELDLDACLKGPRGWLRADAASLSGGRLEARYPGSLSLILAPLASEPGSQRLRVELKAGASAPGLLLDLRLAMPFAGQEDWLTLPALFYGHNHDAPQQTLYPCGAGEGWCFRADGSSAPGLHLPGPAFGAAVFSPGDRFAPLGPLAARLAAGAHDVLGVGFFGPAGRRGARFTAPAQEEPKTYHKPDELGEPAQPRLDLGAGEGLSFELQLFKTGPGRSAYQAPLASLSRRGRPASVDGRLGLLEPTGALFARCLRESHFLPGLGFSHRQDLPELQTGWCGGFASVEAGLAWGASRGDAELERQAGVMGDFICSTALSKSGYFLANYWEGEWLPSVKWARGRGLHVRTAAEGSLFLARLLKAEEARGRSRPAWRQALFSNLEACLKHRRADGALPLQVDPATGEPLDYDGATPGLWAGALAVGAELKGGEQGKAWMQAAGEVARHYAQAWVAGETYYGGPYDADKAPNMEDPYGLLIAFTELAKRDPHPDFLQAALACAGHLRGWQYAYDTVFPAGTVCAREAVSTWGMAPASVRNRHIQNWETVAALSLAELSDLSGDPAHRRRALDHLAQSCQLVERGEGRLGIPLGGQSEQWYATEFRWFGDSGDYGKGNLWKVSVVLPKSGFLTALGHGLGAPSLENGQ